MIPPPAAAPISAKSSRRVIGGFLGSSHLSGIANALPIPLIARLKSTLIALPHSRRCSNVGLDSCPDGPTTPPVALTHRLNQTDRVPRCAKRRSNNPDGEYC